MVVRDHAVRAFTAGRGRIYVSDGAVLVCRNEAQLAAILAHEMGHQLAGHLDGGGGSRTAAYPFGSMLFELDSGDEIEADRLSLSILRSAGYDPHAALDIARRVQDGCRSRNCLDATRVEALRRGLESYPARGRLDTPEYRELRRRLAALTESR